MSRMRLGRKLLIAALILAVYVLHQDWWNWRKVEPLVFGFMPVGLAYHAAYSIVASILMAVLVQVAWPRHLEDTRPLDPQNSPDDKEDHQ